jgi:REP element-mobilizing transposase RayT
MDTRKNSLRLQGYDYTQCGAYFITICCAGRICRFGDIVVDDRCDNNQRAAGSVAITGARLLTNALGHIAAAQWDMLAARFPGTLFPAFVVMPNHVHGIIVIGTGDGSQRATTVGAGFIPARPSPPDESKRAAMDGSKRATTRVAPTMVARSNDAPSAAVGRIVGAYKSLTANECLAWHKTRCLPFAPLWQRGYHDHIIRDEESYQRIVQYIHNNPSHWADDTFHV